MLRKSILIAASYGLIMLTVNYALGFIGFNFDRDSIQARDAGAALILPVLTALCVIGQILVVKISVRNLAPLIAHRRSKTKEHMNVILLKIINDNIHRALPFMLCLAFLIMITYLSSQQIISANPGTKYRFVLLFQALPLWLSILYFTYSVLIVYRIMGKHVSYSLRIRLFEIERMQPLSNVVLVNFFVASLLVSVYPIQTIVLRLPLVDIMILSGFLLLILGLLLWPLAVVRKTLFTSRENTLDRLNESLNIQLNKQPEKPTTRRLVDDNLRLQFISDLLLVRKEVSQTALIPIGLPFTAKLTMLMFLPFVSWVGAALVSQALKVVVIV